MLNFHKTTFGGPFTLNQRFSPIPQKKSFETRPLKTRHLLFFKLNLFVTGAKCSYMRKMLQKPQDANAKVNHVHLARVYTEKQLKSRAVKKKSVLFEPPPLKCKGWFTQNAFCILLRCFFVVFLAKHMIFTFVRHCQVSTLRSFLLH